MWFDLTDWEVEGVASIVLDFNRDLVLPVIHRA
jgi:hypothetical protein